MSWPITNRSDTLHIDYFYLQRQVSKYLYLNYNPAVLDDEQAEEVDEVINLGLMQYYFPPVLPPEIAVGTSLAHEWSFMRPSWDFETVADQRRYSLPADWERPISDLCYINTDANFYKPIKFTSAARLRAIQYQTDYTTNPEYAAIEMDSQSGVEPQTQVLVLHPTPDNVYALSCQYQAVARKLTSDQPYPLGGQLHGQGILASVMASAEYHKNHAHGPMYQDFLQKLASAVLRDQARGADLLGYNGNGADGFHGRGDVRRANMLTYGDVTYGNTAYSGD